MHAILITAAIGYFLGSVPFGYLLVRAFRGADVRTTGSGNIGATNVARMSPVLGVITLLLDAMKGFGAVWAASVLFPGQPMIPFVAGFAAVAGHIFPLWLRFKGGKGVATGLGSFLMLTPKGIVLALVVFLLVLAVFRLVALGSIVASASLPVSAFLLREGQRPTGIAMLSASALLIIVKHHQNIARMLRHIEPKFLD
ncbi:MAG: acyl-phosphate glycerol 3-phosphate acyltransferase [Acidobacteria bacterium]|nr:MAG: acyl-phosphate glycerol 3-phosphate acyltransferase [Acidobacteriota bacterium]PYV71582.1 MAG: acyl-phosphate glycerol 3-phosphate acyltransferase [Acidobacteriota bacterium]